MGQINEDTGFLVNIADLKQLIQERVLEKLDHKHLDKDVPHFSKVMR